MVPRLIPVLEHLPGLSDVGLNSPPLASVLAGRTYEQRLYSFVTKKCSEVLEMVSSTFRLRIEAEEL